MSTAPATWVRQWAIITGQLDEAIQLINSMIGQRCDCTTHEEGSNCVFYRAEKWLEKIQ